MCHFFAKKFLISLCPGLPPLFFPFAVEDDGAIDFDFGAGVGSSSKKLSHTASSFVTIAAVSREHTTYRTLAYQDSRLRPWLSFSLLLFAFLSADRLRLSRWAALPPASSGKRPRVLTLLPPVPAHRFPYLALGKRLSFPHLIKYVRGLRSKSKLNYLRRLPSSDATWLLSQSLRPAAQLNLVSLTAQAPRLHLLKRYPYRLCS